VPSNGDLGETLNNNISGKERNGSSVPRIKKDVQGGEFNGNGLAGHALLPISTEAARSESLS